ncbi:hypothetical protein [Acinetobacter sp. WZC-1]
MNEIKTLTNKWGFYDLFYDEDLEEIEHVCSACGQDHDPEDEEEI